MRIFKRKKQVSIRDVISQSTVTGSTGTVLTLEMLEKAFEQAQKIPQPTGIELRWKLAFRKQYPFIRLMRVGKWTYGKYDPKSKEEQGGKE